MKEKGKRKQNGKRNKDVRRKGRKNAQNVSMTHKFPHILTKYSGLLKLRVLQLLTVYRLPHWLTPILLVIKLTFLL
jgi:hypothetical protein